MNPAPCERCGDTFTSYKARRAHVCTKPRLPSYGRPPSTSRALLAAVLASIPPPRGVR